MPQMFQTSGVESLDISGWDMRSVTSMHNMFLDASSLAELGLGANVNLHPTVELRRGIWWNGNDILTTSELITHHNANRPNATWTLEVDRQVTFNLNNGSAMARNESHFSPQTVQFGGIAAPPASDPVCQNREFIGWYTAVIGGEPFDFAARITSDTVVHARWGLLRPMYVVFHFDGQTVSLPVVDEAIDQTQVPVPATRYGRVGVPGQAFMGWYTSISARMHYINNPNRATAFNISQPIVPDMADASGHLNLHGSWLMYGDVNGDGVIDGIDRVLLQGFTMGEPIPIIIATADVNVDRRVDGIDRVLLQNFMLGGAVILGVPYPGRGNAGNGNAGRGMDLWDGFVFEGELAGAVVDAGESTLFAAGAVDVADIADIAYLNSEDAFVLEPGLSTAVDAADAQGDAMPYTREIQEQTAYHVGDISNIRTLDAVQYVNVTVGNNNLPPAYVYAASDSNSMTTYTTALFNGEYAITFYFASIAIEPTSATGQNGLVTRTITYTYDTARRLTREQVTGAGAITRVYTFDTRGNRTRMVVTGLENYTVTYMYDLNNRLTREEQVDSHGVVSAFVFTYDRNGNQRTRAEVGAMGLETRAYNAFNQLVQFSDGNVGVGGNPGVGGIVSTYSYRADGLRHTVMVNGIRMYHVWLRNHIVLERNGRREVTELYVRGAGGRLIRSHNHLWFLYNNRGDVVQRVDNTGQVLHTYRFGAFGVEINPDPSNSNRFRFAGEYHDLHRGNEIFLRARVYNARLGRFSQEDPLWNIHNSQDCIWSILQAGNLFVYCGNDPVNRIDPSGLAFFIIHCPDFGNQANWMGNQLTGDLPVYTFGVDNTPDFINKWNTLIYNYTNPIHGIFIFSHGFNHGIWFSSDDIGISMDGRNRHNTADIHSVAELNILYLHGAVHLFSCNTGHLDSYFRSGAISGRTGGNFAAALSTRVTGYGVVRAFDGAVSFGARGISPISTRITGNYRPRLASSLTGGQNGFVWLRDRYGQLGTQSQRSPRGVQQFRDGTLNNTFHPHPIFIR